MTSIQKTEHPTATHSPTAAEVTAARGVLAAHDEALFHEAVSRAWIFGGVEETARHFDSTAEELRCLADELRHGKFPPYGECQENYVTYSHAAIEALASLRNEYPHKADGELFPDVPTADFRPCSAGPNS